MENFFNRPPALKCKNCGAEMFARDSNGQCPVCGKNPLKRVFSPEEEKQEAEKMLESLRKKDSSETQK